MREQGSFLPDEVILEGDRYFLASIWAQGDSWSVEILQHNFASKALFLSLILKMPNPPRFLWTVTFCQLTRCNFRFSSVEPQRKSRQSLSTELQTLIGTLMHCITYSGIGVTADLMRTSLPAGESSLVF